jgi:hypothetical protein
MKIVFKTEPRTDFEQDHDIKQEPIIYYCKNCVRKKLIEYVKQN